MTLNNVDIQCDKCQHLVGDTQGGTDGHTDSVTKGCTQFQELLYATKKNNYFSIHFYMYFFGSNITNNAIQYEHVDIPFKL